jgi:hypothetical protein
MTETGQKRVRNGSVLNIDTESGNGVVLQAHGGQFNLLAETTMRLKWIEGELQMGTWTHASEFAVKAEAEAEVRG